MDWVDEHHHLWDCFPFDSFSFESSFHLPLSWCRVDPWCCHPSHLWPENLSLRSSPLPTNDRRREPGKDGLRRKRWIEPLSICCEVGRVDFRRQGHQICASVWGKPIFGSVAGRGVEGGAEGCVGVSHNVMRARFTSTARSKTFLVQIVWLSVCRRQL